MSAFDHCRCRPSCLAEVTPDDDVRLTEVGFVLVDHVDPAVAYPQESLFELHGQAAS